jgi:hypothetical protein
MKRRSQLITVTALSLTLLLQSCSFQKKAQCNKLVENINQINNVWKKAAAIKTPAVQKAPKTQAEANQRVATITAPIVRILEEVDPLLSELQNQEINDKLITVYQNNLLFLHIQRSNIFRKGMNSLRVLAPGAGIAEMPMRSGGSMSESAPVANSDSTTSSSPQRPLTPQIYNGGVSVAGTMFEGETVRIARVQREQKVRMAQMTQALNFLREMQTLDEEIKPQELSIMRRVSASCDIPMPKTE